MIEQFTLNNGLRVICEQLPHLRSVSMGVWVKAGSILESLTRQEEEKETEGFDSVDEFKAWRENMLKGGGTDG